MDGRLVEQVKKVDGDETSRKRKGKLAKGINKSLQLNKDNQLETPSHFHSLPIVILAIGIFWLSTTLFHCLP